jgi:hypothetical protein
MASELSDKGEVQPFMATDLLVSPPSAHYHRHDLESFFYIFIWAVVHCNLKKNSTTIGPTLAQWGDQYQTLTSMSGPGSAGSGTSNNIMKLRVG